ncbi:DNA alkylation repair protein [Herbiconiux ginsengi]|uniref:DNA alkylation repair enzyme n=1 Tax=Herbiconiux ginsengi TaxID=381665 RepID=A0A1H3S8H8_9MICO|nr:DNA alkylation repair protein [Herbiconiux ginsengi]SDZ34184.1 DNA alkylation repair enzyme [Herbiconiux ginsengi]
MELTAAAFLSELDARRSDAELAKYERYFPLAERGDDVFIGVRMGEIFALAKERTALPLDEIEVLLESPVHEARVAAVSVMDFQARARSTTPSRRHELFELYLRRHDRIDTWDLVDRSAIHVLGDYLVDHPRDVLDELARSAHPTHSGWRGCSSTTPPTWCRRRWAGWCARPEARG